MKAGEFLRKVKRYADRRQLSYRWAPVRGQGSHGAVYVGVGMTIVKDLKKELGTGLFRSMCRDLGIDPKDL